MEASGGEGAARHREVRGGTGGDARNGAGGARTKAAAHGVGGHWKRQPHGPGGTLRRWIHVAPYWRGVRGIEEGAVEWVIPRWGEGEAPT